MSDTLVNTHAESELLGALLRENQLIDRIADVIEGEDFSEPLHRDIFDAAMREVSLGKPANPISLRGYLEDPAYLMQLTGAYVGSDAYETAKLLRDLSIRRRMRAGLSVASEACADLTVNPSEIIEHADAAVADRAKDSIHQPTAGQCLDELVRGFADKAPGVTCGAIGSLDALLGPMRPKQLIIGAGRPGMGKTALALSYAIGAAQRGHGVLFVSLEMSSAELAARMASDLCFSRDWNIPFSAIRDGTVNEWQRAKVVEAGNHAHGLPFQVVDAGSLTMGRLQMLVRRHARRMKAKGQSLDLVIVDYLQLLSPEGRGRSAYETVSEVSRGLKALAKDNGVAVFALAQLSREVEKRQDKRPQLSDLRDSGQIEQDADAVLFLMRPEYYLRQDEPDPTSPRRAEWEQELKEAHGEIDFIIAKRRNGVTGTARGTFHGAFQAVR